ncbi:MAG TPA: VWA domain-containing protein [Steroidobacteraceae bacterium]|nr:VWA domain-containing protein [Steroidobacteraceae bacterium]
MIHFAWPWMAVLAPLPLLVYRLRRAAEPGGSALFLPFVTALGSSATSVDRSSKLLRFLFGAIWLLLVIAAVRPQWLGDPVPLPTTGRRLLLAVDVSGSMAEKDMAEGASRLQVVQQVAGHFIDGRKGDRVGLILFGTRPYLQAPLTADLATVHRFLDDAVVGIAGQETAIGDAIGLALKRLSGESDAASGAEEDVGRKTVLILLTDGVSNAGVMPPLQAAKLAAETGMRIYTIGVGAAETEGFFGLSMRNTDLDEDTLKTIAKATGGEYFRATDEQALQEVYHRIDRLEPTAGQQQWLRPADEWFTWPLALALLLSVPAAWMGARAWA